MTILDSKRVIVKLRETPEHPCVVGFEIVLDESGELPDVIIFDTWVFRRDGNTDQYVACTAAVRLEGAAYGVPLKRVYYDVR
jgi:hypothetical protein